MVENDIDGKTLLSLNDEDLANLGVDDVSNPAHGEVGRHEVRDQRRSLLP